MKIKYVEKSGLNPTSLKKVKMINNILEEYSSDGYRLTLRQLYYQLVSRDLIPNKKSEYAKLSSILVKARMAGLVDWEAIEDRVRVPYIPYSVDDVEDAIDDTISQYRLDRQQGQYTHIEVWCEKDALSGILKRITRKYHVKLMINKGYCSCTAMHDAFQRFKRVALRDEKVLVLYLGDHDPSGLDMVRDIRERTTKFFEGSGWDDVEDYFEVKHIGLTMEQIKKFAPPPNPAKITDPRADSYIERFGRVSWEVDALSPQVLHELLEKNIKSEIDLDKYNQQMNKEEIDKESLKTLKEKYDEGI